MKGGRTPQLGFTIVETLIVLAVTAMIFFSVVLLVSSKVNKTEFTQASNDLVSVLQQRINEVINGFYPNNNNLQCIASSPTGPPALTTGPKSAGTSDQCVLIGKVMQFAVGSATGQQLNTYTVAALRAAGGALANGFDTAQPVLVASGNQYTPINGGSYNTSGFPDNEFESQNLEYGLTVSALYYNNTPANTTGSVGILSSLGSTSGGVLQSGAQQVGLYAFAGTNPGDSKVNAVTTIDKDLYDTSNTNMIAVNSIQLCLNSGGTKESILINIGPGAASGSSDQLAVTRTVYSNTGCT